MEHPHKLKPSSQTKPAAVAHGFNGRLPGLRALSRFRVKFTVHAKLQVANDAGGDKELATVHATLRTAPLATVKYLEDHGT